MGDHDVLFLKNVLENTQFTLQLCVMLGMTVRICFWAQEWECTTGKVSMGIQATIHVGTSSDTCEYKQGYPSVQVVIHANAAQSMLVCF